MAAAHETARARATLDDLERGLARAERHHDACWDATVHLSALCERALELKRELRARVIAGNDLSRALPARAQDSTVGELRSRIRLLDEVAPPAEVQSAFLDLYTAELMVDGARAELLRFLAALPAQILDELGEHAPAEDELVDLPRPWAVDAIARHAGEAAPRGPHAKDPVDQVNCRRWLVELAQGAKAYILQLQDEMTRRRAELSVLEREAASVEFFDEEELVEIERALILQKARLAACQEQIDALTPTAEALDKRLEACQAELEAFLNHAG